MIEGATTPQDSGGARAAPSALLFENLSKTFGGQKALDHASLDVRQGEVHGLLGQNGSGKSTLIKILAGFHAPDPGCVCRILDEDVALPMPSGAFRKYRIAFVHQHLGLIPSLSVLDNLLIGDLANSPTLRINWAAERRRALALFERYGIRLDPGMEVQRLAPVDRALLAIVRAVDEMQRLGSGGKGVLVLDEPTPFLPRQDAEKLFEVVRNIVAEGASVIFVSHDVDEVLAITDRATILRDGKVSGTLVTRDAGKSDFVEMIVGRKFVAYDKAPMSTMAGDAAVTITALRGETVADFSLSAQPGEVVGLTGLVGSGYANVPYLLFGAKAATGGTLDLGNGPRNVAKLAPAASIEAGVVLVPGDRANAAAIGALPITDNVTMPVLDSVFRGWALTRRGMVALAEDLGRRFEVLPNRPALPLSALSGGNQQKVVLAKWLQRSPRLVLLDEPTQGVDVGARQAVYAQIAAATRSGAVVICASSDYEQLEMICDRVLIFSAGSVIAELTGSQISKSSIAELCYGPGHGVPATETSNVRH